MGICNLAYCVLEIKENIDTIDDVKQKNNKYDILDWKRIHLDGSKKDIEALSLSLLDLLDTITYTVLKEQTNIIWLIENQPAFKAPTMKSLQMVIYTYAMMLKKNVDANTTAKLISASSKLKYIEKQTGIKVAKTYKSHKDSAIQFVNTLLQSRPVHESQLFNVEKKKDDMADCLLQALYFIDAF